ncbi:MAG TPA: VanW family protein, partial [Bacillota bacterium]|nr:VanW family protein [Bacillota bacterium]
MIRLKNRLENFISQPKGASKYQRYCLLVFWVTFICLMVIYFQFIYLPGDRIAKGVKVEGVELGGLTKEKAKKKLQAYVRQTIQEPIGIRFHNRIWFFMPNYNGFSIDMDQTIHNAWLVGRRGFFGQRFRQRLQVKMRGLTLQCLIIEKKPIVDIFLQMLSEEINRPASPVKIIGKNNDLPVIAPEIPGYKLQKELLRKRLIDIVCKKGPRRINMPVRLEMPKLTKEVFTKYHIQLIGTYTTLYDPQKLERAENINLAAQAVNGTVLFPGEIFSYNSIVGLRSITRGYKEAPVIVKGELLPDIGGGVCQVSTTVYNAALYARLEIVERQNHSRLIPYVPLGEDATVINEFIDLKIKNNQPNPVIFTCTIDGSKLQVD